MTYVAQASISTVAAGPPFSPTDVAGLEAWWDFSDITKLYQDSGKTTPVASDGDVIGAVVDKSGNGNDATQGTTTNKPVYKVNIQNGLSIARFITDDYLDFSGVSYDDMHWFFVVKGRVENNYNGIISQDATHYIIFSKPSNLYSEYNNTLHYGLSLTQAQWNLIGWIHDGTKQYTSLNTSKDSGTAATSTTETPIYLGVRYNAYYFDGDMGEILIYNAEITGADLASLETYFDNKWSLPY